MAFSLLGLLKKLIAPEPVANVASALPVVQAPRWILLVGDEQLGELTYVGYETPWITADFVPMASFERFKAYVEWAKESDAHEDDHSWELEISEELKAVIHTVHSGGGFQIRSLEDGEQREALLHFGDNYSWATFR